MIPSTSYDVVVIGGGPAGATAARYVAEGGASVLLLDRKRDLGTPVRCGEGVGALGLAQFVKPDPRWIASEIRGARLHAPNGTFLEVDDLGLGYVLERKMFDRHLVEIALAAGADILTEASAMGLARSPDGQINGVRVRHFGEEAVVPTKLVIGADGVDSRVGRWAGIRTDVRMREMESCAQYLVANCGPYEGFCEFFLGMDVAPGGYGWIFPKGDGMANIGLGIGSHYTRRLGSAREHLDRFMQKVAPEGRVMGFMIGGVPVPDGLERIADDGIMLVGDSARQVNPLTGGGIVSGMMAGKIAGETAADAIVRAGDVSRKTLMAYETRWAKGVGKSHQRHYRIKEAISKITDATLNDTVSTFQAKGQATTSLLRVFGHILRRQPKLLWDVRHVFLPTG